jgi:hypothetical protein
MGKATKQNILDDSAFDNSTISKIEIVQKVFNGELK